MLLRDPLDHDILIDREGKVYVVVGNTHPLNYIIAYIKYVPTYRRTPWFKDGIYYERVLKVYDVRELRRNCTEYQECVYDPILDALTPILRVKDIMQHLIPSTRLKVVLKEPKDELERKLTSLCLELYSLGVSIDDLGVTGSILVGMHNPKMSDIDLVVYGWLSAKKFMEVIRHVAEPLPRTYVKRVVKREFSKRGLDPRLKDHVLPICKRFMYKGTVVNVIYVNTKTSRTEYSVRNLGSIEVRAKLKPTYETICYPSIVKVIESEVIKGLKNVRISSIISYDYFLSFLLYHSKEVLVRGILQYVESEGTYRVLIGGAEVSWYVKPLELNY
ncbi:MAG: hypothetical protein DRO18_05140 [Thermoprotei archaeon]|nr:MAG: hypothetical protein DRO18_05140 [Thermoprotei archaeon]